MINKLKIFRQIIFYSAIAFFAIGIFSLTFGQRISYEFRNFHTAQLFYEIIFFGLPISLLLTMAGTIRPSFGWVLNLGIGTTTIIAAFLCFRILLSLIFQIGFGNWTDMVVFYRLKTNENVKIVEQQFDVGAFGYRGKRFVKLEPSFFFYFKVEKADTSKMNKNEWIVVNEDPINK